MSTEKPSVVIGTPLVPGSDEVVSAGVRVAQALGAAIHLVHAYDMPLLPAEQIRCYLVKMEVCSQWRQGVAGSPVPSRRWWRYST
jgi:hypothetical protein